MKIQNTVDLSLYALLTDIEGFGKVASGTYSGNVTENRAIAHGLGGIPKLVIVQETYGGICGFIIFGDYEIIAIGAGFISKYIVTEMDATSFYVGNVGSYANSFNDEWCDYYWTAIG